MTCGAFNINQVLARITDIYNLRQPNMGTIASHQVFESGCHDNNKYLPNKMYSSFPRQYFTTPGQLLTYIDTLPTRR